MNCIMLSFLGNYNFIFIKFPTKRKKKTIFLTLQILFSERKFTLLYLLYLEIHNEVGSQSQSRPSPLVSFELRTFQLCVMCYPSVASSSYEK